MAHTSQSFYDDLLLGGPQSSKGFAFVRGPIVLLQVPGTKGVPHLLPTVAPATVLTSGLFLAEMSVTSPRKLVIFIIFKKKIWIDVHLKKIYLILKTEALVLTQ